MFKENQIIDLLTNIDKKLSTILIMQKSKRISQKGDDK